jgi:hypothetical protein
MQSGTGTNVTMTMRMTLCQQPAGAMTERHNQLSRAAAAKYALIWMLLHMMH